MFINFLLLIHENNTDIVIISHRGASGEEKEHTFDAYDLAILYGSKYIEQDLVTSKDGTLYVSHDRGAKRLTGIDQQYSQMTDSEIKQISKENGNEILTLQQVFDRYDDSVIYVIELKEGGAQSEKFINIVRKNQLSHKIMLQSFDIITLENVEKEYPNMVKMMLFSSDYGLDNAIDKDFIDIICVKKQFMTQDNMDRVHNAGKDFFVYTLNSMSEIKKGINLEIDGFFTNYTAKAIRLLKEK